MKTIRVPLPERLRQNAQAGREAAEARDAATIAVIRDGESGTEVFLMRRQTSMAFAAGMYVFPGGGVHPDDARDLPWAGPEPGYFASRFGCDSDTARALVVAAVRETFEETGILLAGHDERRVVADASEYHEARGSLERHELTFADFLNDRDLVLRADLVGAWAHWITPKFEPRRYDTRFFVTTLPRGQRIDSVSSEADRSLWVPISEVLDAVDAGSAAMMPPTITTCRELSTETTGSLLRTAAARTIHPIEPRLVEIDGELWLEREEA